MFERILIACRGEVGARVARTCRRLGLDTVAVHVAGEQDEVHVEACDEAIEIGSEAVAYADPDLLVAAAAHANVGAVHTGYGLGLDEARLARALADREIAYVGAHYERLEASFDLLRVRAAASVSGPSAAMTRSARQSSCGPRVAHESQTKFCLPASPSRSPSRTSPSATSSGRATSRCSS
ncbi:MAG: hypothetical protein K8H88_29970 [Sandaracinaceae bacterium]|nr:hypothetical protein [Sandaracinaceae bacterium]